MRARYPTLENSIATLLLCVGAALAATPAMARGAHAARPVPAPAVTTDAGVMALADDYFDHFYFPSNPTTATADGVHRYDDRLEDYGRAEVDRQVKALQGYERRVQAVNAAGLSERVRGDAELLLSNIRSNLLTLQVIRPWEKDADSYPSGISEGALTLMERDFAPLNERLRLLCARERLMPAALRAARTNLVNPPRVYTEIAIEQLPSIVSFFEHDLPAAFSAAGDAALQREFAATNSQVIAALKAYQGWLRDDLLPRSRGDFRIGAATLRAKLADDEMVDTPLERLLEIGAGDLRRNQAEFARVARELAPDKNARQVLADLDADHPQAQQLLDSFRATFDGLVSFITDHQ